MESTSTNSSEFSQATTPTQSSAGAKEFMAALILVHFSEQRIPSDRTEQYVLNVFNGVADDGEGVEDIDRIDDALKSYASYRNDDIIMVEDNAESSESNNSCRAIESDHCDRDDRGEYHQSVDDVRETVIKSTFNLNVSIQYQNNWAADKDEEEEESEGESERERV